MSKIEQLEKQMAEIAAAIEVEKSRGRDEALETVRKLIKQFGISQREVKGVLLARKIRVSKINNTSNSVKNAAPIKPKRK